MKYDTRLFDDLNKRIGMGFDDVFCFVADDVQAMLDATPGDNYETNWQSDDYGAIAPPADNFWIEAIPQNEHLPDGITGMKTGLSFLDITHDADRLSLLPEFSIPDDTYWLLSVAAWRREDYGTRTMYGLPGGLVLVSIDRAGNILTTDGSFKLAQIEPDDVHLQAPDVQVLPASMSVLTLPMGLFALNHMFKRGTHIVDVDPADTMPRNYRRKLERKGSLPRSYQFLDLHPQRKRYQPKDITHKGKKKRQHFRRGHFAFYGPDAPHVSGFIGAMYRKATIVGAEEEGSVEKTYRLRK